VIALLRRSIAQARYVLIGSAVLLTVFQLVIVGQAAEIQRSQSFGRIAELLPAFLQRGLGSRAMLLATFRGTVCFGYFHPVVCLLVVVIAMYFATEPAHEVEVGLVDLELARALPRWRLLARSLALSNLAIVAATLLMAVGTSIGGALFDTAGMDMPEPALRVRLLVNLLAVASCFGAFALLVGALSKRWATAFTTGALTAVVAYLVDFLSIGWRPMRVLNWLSPFHYYPALSVIAGDAPVARNVVILLTAAVGFATAAFWQFQRRDL
jgi:ABC-type transport system involved in multi-copper enzyme maturation permease subunit